MSKGMIINCPNCKFVGATRLTLKGSFAVEIALWLCAIVPGFIYSVWRRSNKGYVCPSCNYEYVAKIGDSYLPPTLSEIIGNSILRIIGIILCMIGIAGLIGSFSMQSQKPIGVGVLAPFLFLGTWLIVRDLRKKTKMITLTTVMVLFVSIVSIPNFMPKQESIETKRQKVLASIENKGKTTGNRQAELPGHDIGYTTPTRTPEEIIASIEKVGKYPGFTQNEIDELTAKISEKGRQAALSEGQTLKVIEKIVIVYKLEMIQAGDTPKEKQAVIEKTNDMIDSEINAVKTQVERERELVEVGSKEGEILLQNQRNALIDTETGTSKKQLEEKRKFIKKQIDDGNDELRILKDTLVNANKKRQQYKDEIDRLNAEMQANKKEADAFLEKFRRKFGRDD